MQKLNYWVSASQLEIIQTLSSTCNVKTTQIFQILRWETFKILMHWLLSHLGLKLHSSLRGVNSLACTPLVPFFPAGESVSSSPSPLPFSAVYQSLTDKRSIIYWKSQQSDCSVALARAVGFLLLVINLGICVLWYHFPFYTWLGWVFLPWKLFSVIKSRKGPTTSPG